MSKDEALPLSFQRALQRSKELNRACMYSLYEDPAAIFAQAGGTEEMAKLFSAFSKAAANPQPNKPIPEANKLICCVLDYFEDFSKTHNRKIKSEDPNDPFSVPYLIKDLFYLEFVVSNIGGNYPDLSENSSLNLTGNDLNQDLLDDELQAELTIGHRLVNSTHKKLVDNAFDALERVVIETPIRQLN